jgi:hypothetical protein
MGSSKKLKSNLQEVRARGAELYVLADRETSIADAPGLQVVRLPRNCGLLNPLLYALPLQMLAYHAALIRVRTSTNLEILRSPLPSNSLRLPTRSLTMNNSMQKIAVVGLGYVGLPLAVEFGRRYITKGIDLDERKIAAYEQYVDPTGEVSSDELRAAKYLSVTTDAGRS